MRPFYYLAMSCRRPSSLRPQPRLKRREDRLQ